MFVGGPIKYENFVGCLLGHLNDESFVGLPKSVWEIENLQFFATNALVIRNPLVFTGYWFLFEIYRDEIFVSFIKKCTSKKNLKGFCRCKYGG